MKTVQLSHLAVALVITGVLGLGLGVALQDAAPAVIFIATLTLATVSGIAFLNHER